jgi:Retroviral aspartyl protease
MRSISGRLTPRGPFIDVTVMQTEQHVARLKAARRPVATPAIIRSLIDTGASGCVLDNHVVSQLGLIQTGMTQIHTPTTGAAYEERNQYDVCVFFGSQTGEVKAFTVGVIATDLASEGFLAIIGWDILSHCTLVCDGPNQTFKLDY